MPAGDLSLLFTKLVLHQLSAFHCKHCYDPNSGIVACNVKSVSMDHSVENFSMACIVESVEGVSMAHSVESVSMACIPLILK